LYRSIKPIGFAIPIQFILVFLELNAI